MENLNLHRDWRPCPYTDGNRCMPDCPLYIEEEKACAEVVKARQLIKISGRLTEILVIHIFVLIVTAVLAAKLFG